LSLSSSTSIRVGAPQINLGTSGSATNVSVGNTTTSSTLNVSGKITATAIGSYEYKYSTYKSVAGQAYDESTAPACDSGGIVINCAMEPLTGTRAFTVRGEYLDSTANNVCTVKVFNELTTAVADSRSFRASALCYYPQK
jgi:hypothetical protein